MAPRYRRVIARSCAAFVMAPIAVLLLIGRVDAVAWLPAELMAARVPLLALATPATFAGAAGIGIVAGEILLVLLLLARRRVGGTTGAPIGGARLVARHPGELLGAALAAVSAGIGEELFFRMFLPFVVALVTGSAIAGMAVGAIAFGLVHWYQGWIGAIATFAVGAVLAGLYLGSGMLWLAMLVHAAIDLNVLVLRPAIGGFGRPELKLNAAHHPGEDRGAAGERG